MHAECSVQFHFSPQPARWSTSVSLRVSAALLAKPSQVTEEECDNTARYADEHADTASSQLQLLLYVSRFHRLEKVEVEGELIGEKAQRDVTGAIHEGSPLTHAADEEAPMLAASESAFREACDQTKRAKMRTVLRDYSWAACRRPVTHVKLRDYSASQVRQPRVSAESPEKNLTTLNTAAEPSEVAESPQPLFSTLFSTIPSSVGLDSNEDVAEGKNSANKDLLELHFDSLSSSENAESTAPPESVEAPANLQRTAPCPLSAPASGPFASKGGDQKSANAAIENDNACTPANVPDTSVQPFAAQTIEATALPSPSPPAQRRLLLLRPGTSNEGVTSSPTAAAPNSIAPASCTTNGIITSASPVMPAPPEMLHPQSAPPVKGRRVLNINASVKAPIVVEQAQPLAAAASALPPPPPLVPLQSANLPELDASSAHAQSWTPHVLSFHYPSISSGERASKRRVFDNADDNNNTEQKLRERSRLVALHLTFADLATSADEKPQSSAEESPFWFPASVAACGWFTARGGPLGTEGESLGERENGYALIMVDASLQATWICPLVAPLFNSAVPAQGVDLAEDHPLVAGPLLDVWVSAVESTQHSTMRQSAWVSKPRQGRLTVVKQEQTFEDDGSQVAEMLPRSLPCLHFTPSWLSQLSCSFGPPQPLPGNGEADSDAGAKTFYLSKSGKAFCEEKKTAVVWPSSTHSSLVWIATQQTTDCVLLRLSSSPARFASPTPVGDLTSDEGAAQCVFLQGDAHLADALHTHYQHVRRWCSQVLCSSRSTGFATEVATTESDAAQLCFQVVVTRLAPPSLSLRGGAVGTSHGIVVSEETARAADLARVIVDSSFAGCSTMLRARVAVTAAMIQHVLCARMQPRHGRCESTGGTQHTGTGEGRHRETNVKGNDLNGPTSPCLDAVQLSDVRDDAARQACVARALALQWTLDRSAFLNVSNDAVLQFLTEERFILTSAFAAGKFLCEHEDSRNGEQTERQQVGVHIMRSFQQRYVASSLAALSWLAPSTSVAQWVQRRGVTASGSVVDQQMLGRWALNSACHRGAERAFRAGFCKAVEQLLPSDATLSNVMPAPCVKGIVDVRIQHAADVNALRIDLDWCTTASCNPESLALVTGTGAAAVASVELPFLLLVFVLEGSQEEEKRKVMDDLNANTVDSDAVGLQQAFEDAIPRDGVRLYQVTPFSWHLPAQSCTAGVGTTDHFSLSVMHAFDLAARRPDAFNNFNVQTVTGLGGEHLTNRKPTGQGVGGRAAKRRRQRRPPPQQSHPSLDDMEFSAGAGAKKDGGGGRARKRRRLQADSNSDDEDSASEGSHSDGGSSDSSGDDADANEDEDDEGEDKDGTLFLNLGSSASKDGGRSRKKETNQRKKAALINTECFTSLDTARVMPVVVLRRDCMAPLLEVEVQQGALLAAQLSAAGYTSEKDTCETSDEEVEDEDDGVIVGARTRRDGRVSATTALCSLLRHWAGYAAVYAACANRVMQLRHRQVQLSFLSLADVVAWEASALTDSSVLCAYAELVRGVLRALLPGASSELTANGGAALKLMVAEDRVLAVLFSSTSIAQTVRSALREYARQDTTCRSRMLTRELEDEFDALAATNTSPADVKADSAGGRKRRITRERQQQQDQDKERQQRRKEREQRDVAEIEAIWSVEGDAVDRCVEAFYGGVLHPLLRTRRTALYKFLSTRNAGARESLTKWMQLTRSSAAPPNSTHVRLGKAIDALRAERASIEPASSTAAKRPAPPTMGPPPTNAASPTRRLQLRALPLPALPAASTGTPHAVKGTTSLPFSVAALEPSPLPSSSSSPLGLSLFELRKRCAAHLHATSPPVTSADTLRATANALLSVSEDPPSSQGTVAAASLGLCVAQLACLDVSGK